MHEEVKERVKVYDQHGDVIGEEYVAIMEAVEAVQTATDKDGRALWRDELDESGAPVMEPFYRMRWLTANATVITEKEYLSRKAVGESVFRAAYVGVTYHCG